MGIQEAIQFPATTEANPYTSQASAAYELFKSEIDGTSGWERKSFPREIATFG